MRLAGCIHTVPCLKFAKPSGQPQRQVPPATRRQARFFAFARHPAAARRFC